MQNGALGRISRWFAVVGGIVVLLVVLMSLVSLIGRKLFSAPIPGDIELLEMAIAVSVTAFLPLCEVNDNHIRVDLIAGFLPEVVNRFLLTACHLLLAAVAGVMCWRTLLLMLNSYEYGSTSTMLAVPLWIPQGLMVPSLALLTICALWRARKAMSGISRRSELDELDELAEDAVA